MRKKYLAVAATIFLLIFASCTKQPPKRHKTENFIAINIDLNTRLKLNSPKIAFEFDDVKYAQIDYEWLKAKIADNISSTWHDKQYTKELKDCDNYAKKLASDIDYWFSKESTADGNAMVAKVDAYIEEQKAWHSVVLFGTDKGWFIADPTAGINYKTRELPLVPLEIYNKKIRKIEFD